VCSLSYPASKVHAPCYIVSCGLSGSNIFFPDYLTKSMTFGKTLLNIKCVLILSTTIVSNISNFSHYEHLHLLSSDVYHGQKYNEKGLL
jgi:hypothetical protein